jgi:hypothetical protein
MAIKTFTTGEVLTASDTNTYLANSGQVLVKSQTVGSGVTSVTVTDAFNADYDAYQIVATNVAASSNGVITLQLSGITTGYYGNLIYANFGNGAPLSVGYNNASNVGHAGGTNSLIATLNLEVINPFLAKAKYITSHFIDNANAGVVQVYNSQTTSATGFVIQAAFGTFTGGQITVYGYRKG